MFFAYILGNAKTCIFNVHLDEYFAVSFMELLVCFYTSIHVRSSYYLTVLIELQLRVYAAYVFAADQCYA